jgi:protein TonB
LRAQGSSGLSEPLVFSSARKTAAIAPPTFEHHEDDHVAPTFGGRMFSEEDAEAESVEAPPRRFPAVAVIAAGLILGAVGGGWYWWHNNAPGVANVAPRPVNLPAPVTAPPSANAQTLPATSSPVPAQGSSKPVEASGHPSAPAPGQPQPVNASLISHEESKPVEKPLGSGEPANKAEKKPALAKFRMSAPSAMRPPSSRNLEPAPSIDSAPAVPGAASPEGIGLVGSAGLQPAAPKPERPAGGELKPARLTSSAPPAYPPLARSQRVEGDVTVDALIDATGRVTTIKVISGPVLLQQAAVSAVHLWKYEPATLNGNAVPMHLVVTVRFRLR